jgi:hypothetical protein
MILIKAQNSSWVYISMFAHPHTYTKHKYTRVAGAHADQSGSLVYIL